MFGNCSFVGPPLTPSDNIKFLQSEGGMATRQATIGDWIKRTLKDEPPRSKSLIITIFGDSIAPYASGIWLGELIELLRPFHVNERLVRTSGFRLAEEGWLESKREGRRSRYSLTRSGLQRVVHAYHRIYDPPLRNWGGNWTVVILSKAGAVAERVELRRELEWEGFGMLAVGIFVHPCADMVALSEVLHRLNLNQSVMVLQARDLKTVASGPATRLASECWNLEQVSAHYMAFLKRFQPALPLLRGAVDPQTAFVVQTLLIHSFRRVVLHDPRLPAALLPQQWPGHAAYDLCREMYLLTYKLASRHLAHHLEPFPRGVLTSSRKFRNRLGGLKI